MASTRNATKTRPTLEYLQDFVTEEGYSFYDLDKVWSFEKDGCLYEGASDGRLAVLSKVDQTSVSEASEELSQALEKLVSEEYVVARGETNLRDLKYFLGPPKKGKIVTCSDCSGSHVTTFECEDCLGNGNCCHCLDGKCPYCDGTGYGEEPCDCDDGTMKVSPDVRRVEILGSQIDANRLALPLQRYRAKKVNVARVQIGNHLQSILRVSTQTWIIILASLTFDPVNTKSIPSLQKWLTVSFKKGS